MRQPFTGPSTTSTVLIQVTERDPVGYLKLADGIHLVDVTGFDYATITTAPAGLPVIREISCRNVGTQ